MLRAGEELRAARRWAIFLLLPLAACAGRDYRPVADSPVRIGKPYSIRGQTYAPVADPAYDELGYASWYGPESGSQTANGERFRPDWVTAAHKTLPLPTYVEVTALDSGRTILVRVNDRGPFARGRLIDLSRGAAELLGIRGQGHAAVRVRRVEPPERDRERLREGDAARERARATPLVLANLRAQLDAGIRAGLVEAPWTVALETGWLSCSVTLAKAGVQLPFAYPQRRSWIPAFAGMTI